MKMTNDDILDDNRRMEDLDGNATIRFMDENVTEFVIHEL